MDRPKMSRFRQETNRDGSHAMTKITHSCSEYRGSVFGYRNKLHLVVPSQVSFVILQFLPWVVVSLAKNPSNTTDEKAKATCC